MNYSGEKYILSLSDGSRWQLAGNADVLLWIDKLASILRLDTASASEQSKEIFFVRNKFANSAADCNFSLAKLANIDDVDEKYLCEINTGEGIGDDQYQSMMFSLQPIYQYSITNGGLPFHAGLIESRGCGILLAASGGTGKSTSCKRLPHNWKPLCDDEALVVLAPENRYRAHPFPTWSDYLWRRAENTWDVQYSVPLCGIFFLEQSERDEVFPLGEGETAVYMTESACQAYQRFHANMSKDDVKRSKTKIFSNACNLAKLLPAFRLRISLHGEFWKKIEESIF
ncbi:MAG: SynChlorMet cassette protein ScmC [Candidatus Electronema sp. V4]|uniref:SynChlorMet cassette protein ScmC n=1 Tax=Candidatus Electronema sp. V4 TaxID=3454756 RepID=UPI00405570C4